MEKITFEQLRFLFDNLKIPAYATLALSIVLFVLLKQYTNNTYLSLWLLLNILVQIMRLYILHGYKQQVKEQIDLSYYYKMYTLLMIASAVLWGSLVFFLIHLPLEIQLFMILMTAGMTSGATGSSSVRLEQLAIYMIFAFTPYLIFALYIDHSISTFIFMALSIYMLAIFSLAKKYSDNINQNITLIADNNQLIQDLKQKADDAMQASRAKSTFLSTMSHEIRTPLNAILGFVQILKSNENDEEKRKYLKTIDASSKTLLHIINDTLDVNKLEQGDIEIELIPFDPHIEFESIKKLYEANAQEKGITLNLVLENLPAVLVSDIHRIKQVIFNLLSNAIKFTPNGGTVDLLFSYDTAQEQLYVEVSDSGIGIDSEHMQTIFEPFKQADSSTTRKYGGTGLGLYISKGFISLLGGTMKVTSKTKGTTFSFTLPMHYSQEVETSTNDNTSKSEDFSHLHILVAEDNKTNQMLIKILLNELNIDVDISNDGVEVVHDFSPKYDIVFMDINMPNKNGVEAMKELKNGGVTVPIIALTANALKSDKEKFLAQGFDDYLAKPIQHDLLVKLLQKWSVTSK